MHTTEIGSTEWDTQQKLKQVASWKHFAGFLLIGAAVVASGMLAQRAPAGSAGGGQLGSHSQAIPVYLVAIFMDWALLYYCWVGLHKYGVKLREITGGRWTSWKDIAVDLGIAVPFWVLWEGTAYGVHWLLGPGHAKTVDSLLPQSLAEIAIWIATSITAGICEEIVFRGYVQRQLGALSGVLWAGVLGQGVVFGLFHAYQGWKNVIVISFLGVLNGILAVWRRNLRINIVTHAWTDIWEGWFKFVVWK